MLRRSDAHLWGEKYSGTVEDVFDLQERLSRRIVEALEIPLSPPEDREIAERPIADIRAFEYYQRGGARDGRVGRILGLPHGLRLCAGRRD
jgi:hypothetical protein